MARVLGAAVSRCIALGYGRGRIWRDETLPAKFCSNKTIELRSNAVEESLQPSSAALGIEVWLPIGPKSYYGLLGLRFESAIAQERVVRVGVTACDGPPFLESIAVGEEPRIGLPEEYAGYVADALERELKAAGVSGIATVDHAVYGLLGSSRRVFERLCALLTCFLVDQLDEKESDTLSLAIRKAFI
jgi:hypothetical protein